MKKYLLSVLVAFVSFLGLTIGVSAANPPETFKTKEVTEITDYVPGIISYYKPIDGGLEVFCEDSGLTYVTGITYKLKGQVHDGYIYIFEHRPNTGNTYKDYYIQSVAIWWFKDYLNGNNVNIPKAKKDYITNHRTTDEVCRLIYELVEGAKAYKQTKGSISFDSSSVTWTESGDYYVSSKITVTGKALTGGTISLVNAPSGSKMINSTIDKTGNGTFQVQVPKSSITLGQTYNFSVKATGKYVIKRMYDYYLEKNPANEHEYQQVIYGKVFTTTYNVNASKDMSLTKNSNKLVITKIDKETNKPLAGASLTLYKGNCASTTCTDKYSSWTSTTSAKEFTNIPVGYYTLVETAAPNGYLVANKEVVHITSLNGTYTINMYDAKAHNKLVIYKEDQNGTAVKNAGLTLYKGNCVNTTCTDKYSSWTTNGSAKEFADIAVGVYTLVETTTPAGYRTAAKMLINIASNNKTYTYKMIDTKDQAIRISKTDVTGDKEVPGATLVLRDASNKIVETWTSTSTPHYITLAPGEYFLRETIAPAGYVLSDETINFKVDANYALYEKHNNAWVKVDYIKMINESEHNVRISKTDVTGTKEIPGAKLVLKDSNNVVVSTWVSTSAPHYETLKSGVYTLTETVAPQGYILSKTSITFKVDTLGNVFQKASDGTWVKVDYIKMINETKESVIVSKLDSETNEYVSGAVLQIKNEKGEIVATWTTTKESHYVSLDEGTYVLSEVSAPQGYNLNNKPIYFRVDGDGNVYLVDSKGDYTVKVNGVIMYNEPEQIIVPATGLSSTLTYALGTLVLGFGAIMLYRNEKQC